MRLQIIDLDIETKTDIRPLTDLRKPAKYHLINKSKKEYFELREFCEINQPGFKPQSSMLLKE